MADTTKSENLEEKLYNRADKVNFMGLTNDAEEFLRMTGFTDSGKSSNASTYERRSVDEKSSRKDVTGYSTEIAYGFDRYTNNKIHEKIAEIHDLEKVGETAPIVTVDFNNKNTDGSYEAKKRIYSILPDSDGDGTDAYQYSGTFGANGDIITGRATVTSDGKKCTFVADENNTPNESAG